MPTSAEALSAKFYSIQRPKIPPPKQLTEEQAGYWRDILVDVAEGQVRSDSVPVLLDLVRLMSYSAQVAGQLDEMRKRVINGPSPVSAKSRRIFDQLTKMHREEAHAIATLSTKLRFTVQSREDELVSEKRRQRAPAGPRPWEDPDMQSWGEQSQ